MNMCVILGSSHANHLCIVPVRACVLPKWAPAFLLYSSWRASLVFHCGLHLHPQWQMKLNAIYHLYPFFGGLFIHIISPLLVGCPFLVRLWMFFVEWRYGKFCIVLSLLWVLSLCSDACRDLKTANYFVIERGTCRVKGKKCAQARMCANSRALLMLLKETVNTVCLLETVADFSEAVSYGVESPGHTKISMHCLTTVAFLPLMSCRLVLAFQKSHWEFFLVPEEPSFSPDSLEFLLLST